MRRSSLPGRNKAASSKSGRDVAARTHTPALQFHLAQQPPNGLWSRTSSIVSKTCHRSMRTHCTSVHLPGQLSDSCLTDIKVKPDLMCIDSESTSGVITIPCQAGNLDMWYICVHHTACCQTLETVSQEMRLAEMAHTLALGCKAKAETCEAFNTIQLCEELVDHSVCNPCGVVASLGSNGIKLIKEHHAWCSCLSPPTHQCTAPFEQLSKAINCWHQAFPT